VIGRLAMNLHHVAVIVSDPERSVRFDDELFGVTPIERPPCKTPACGWAWAACRDI
jgi:hypothetical protein